jgi:hypothetical protein
LRCSAASPSRWQNWSSRRRAPTPVLPTTVRVALGRSRGGGEENRHRPWPQPERAPRATSQFERESDRPAEVIAIHYDTYANLVARGVIREERKLPSPFPGGFVPDPPERG